MLRRATQTTTGRVLLLVGAVGAVMVGSAALAQLAFDEFDDFGDAIWSATLHLLDPSTLRDDSGAAARTIGVFQVVAGLVLLVGLLFTFVAEVVGRSLERLGQSDRPLRARDHLLIVGGADMAGVATAALAEAGRDGELRRLAVLAPESARDSRAELRAKLEREAAGLRVDLMFGDTAGDSGFDLAAAAAARAVLVLPSSSGRIVAETADIEVTQSGLALRDHLRERGAAPTVRMLFRRGRDADACWELFPSEWDAVVGDRTVSALLRLAITRPTDLAELPELFGDRGALEGFGRLIAAGWDRASAAGRPLRLTMVGCGIDAPALMEDLAQVGSERFQVTVIASREAFRAYLGEEDREDVPVKLVEAGPSDMGRLRRSLTESEPDVVLVSPSPLTWDPRASDASATLSVLHVLRTVGDDLPVVAELFLPESARRLSRDPRLLTVTGLRAVSTTIALTLFDPERARALERALGGEPGPT